MAILFHDDFNGSGSLIGHTPDVGPGTHSWQISSRAAMSGGTLVSTGTAGDNGAAWYSPTGGGGAPMFDSAYRATWGWITSYASSAPMNPFIIRLDFLGSVWVELRAREKDEGGFERILNLNNTGWNVVPAYAADTEYIGTLDVTSEGLSLSFLGLELDLPGYLVSRQPYGVSLNPFSYSSLSFLKIDSLGAPPEPTRFWTNLRNAREVS